MENVIDVLRSVVNLIIYTSIFIFFLKSRSYSFVKGFFITVCSFNVIWALFFVLMYRLGINAIGKLLGYGGSLGFISEYIGATGYFLLIFGITFLVGSEYDREGIKTEFPALKGKRRNIAISLLLFVVTLGIYFPFWLYRTVKDLRNNFEKEIPYTPGKAVGFLFIPFFNIYWSIYILFSLPLRMKHIEKKHYGKNIGFYFHPVLISILWIAFIAILELYVINVQEVSSFREMNFGNILVFNSAIIVIVLTIQAKLNAFFDFPKNTIIGE